MRTGIGGLMLFLFARLIAKFFRQMIPFLSKKRLTFSPLL